MAVVKSLQQNQDFFKESNRRISQNIYGKEPEVNRVKIRFWSMRMFLIFFYIVLLVRLPHSNLRHHLVRV